MNTKEVYIKMASAADDTDVLKCLRQDVTADQTLFSTEKDEIYEAIFARYGQLNAKALPPAEQKPRWQTETIQNYERRRHVGCKHLIAILFFVSLCFASPLRACAQVVPPANGQTDGSSLFVRRLAALSMVESGDNDNAVGRAGEVSRFQVRPDVWHTYASRRGVTLDPRNAFTAWNIAGFIMHDRCRHFESRFHRPPDNLEFYILWARPAWYFTRRQARLREDFWIVAQRAARFDGLVGDDDFRPTR